MIFLYLCNLCNLWSKPSLFAFQLSNSGKLPPLSNPLLRFAPEGVLTPPCPNEKTNLIPDLQSSIHDLTAMADREGFEPSVTLPPHTLSKRAHSTTLTPALGGCKLVRSACVGNPFCLPTDEKIRFRHMDMLIPQGTKAQISPQNDTL